MNYKQAMVRYDKVLKFLLIGDPSVGKTCLLMRYTDNNFERNYISTIGLDFRIKTVSYKNKNVKIQVWDTAGQERYISMTKTYFKGANAILLIYDITSTLSFKNIERWLEHIRNNADNEDLVIILVGNKIDLFGAREVSYEMGKTLAEKNDISLFVETSAKDDVNVEKCFNMIIECLISNSSTMLPVVENVKLGETQEKKKKCC